MADFLFDIGKVLLDFDFESSLVTLLPPDHPAPREALAKLIEKKDEFEAGKISVGDYTQWAIETLETTATIEDFHASWQNIFTPNNAMWAAARKLSSDGHRLILFSNTNGIHCPWIFQKYPEFSIFHGSILSFEVDAIKPQPLIYQHAIEKYSLVPEKTLYIDDLPANIRTGNEFGFRSHQYDLNNHPAFEAWLAVEMGRLSLT
ncbi:HAD-IA family hydrolase [Luteolibacter algae]|uniref:HAD-IA family hydrolase n=1 Tax=Luteolibacter algae TaxID=454151 RepID=A0ABW5D8I9_9BACT